MENNYKDYKRAVDRLRYIKNENYDLLFHQNMGWILLHHNSYESGDFEIVIRHFELELLTKKLEKKADFNRVCFLFEFFGKSFNLLFLNPGL